ncbi:MAG: hypothetical protein O9322_17175 [Beijerinckiaceae bacterium]|nr:hypothetical protein [Beijerinckiaceae bacterium]MCZ8301281.1 hypothetical protein [Beijerinckiaceae bacterium]
MRFRAGPVAAVFAKTGLALWLLAALPGVTSPAAALDACKCEDLTELQVTLARTLLLRNRFEAKARELADKFGQNPRGSALSGARGAARDFLEGTDENSAAFGLPPVKPGEPARVEYVNRGMQEQQNWQDAFRRTGQIPQSTGISDGMRWNEFGELVVDQAYRDRISQEWKKAGKNLCDPVNPKKFIEDLSVGAKCAGIARANIEHELSHQRTCEQMGFWAFRDRPPHLLMQDEVKAYTRQAEVLAGEIQRVMGLKRTRVVQKPIGACPECYLEVKVECLRSYHVNGAKGGIVFRQGLVCNVYKPFSLKSVGMSKVEFSMTPKGETSAGTYSYGGTTTGAKFSGSGLYSIAVGENDAKITLYSEGIADTPKAKVEDKGSGTFTMTPLEKNCDE